MVVSVSARCLVLVGLFATGQVAAGAADQWAIARACRAPITVEPLPRDAVRAPFSMEMDFGNLLEKANVEGRFAPYSVAVTRVDAEGREIPVPHAMSEDFAWFDKGTVSWVIEKPDQRLFRVYFDVEEHGPFSAPDQTPLIGNGDNFRSNRPDGQDPIRAMGIAPISADFDGDGLIDLVSRAWYSSTWGQPWFTIWFWRNVGTNEAPVYSDFVRLYADGQPIANDYSGCDLYDWDGDKRLDLVTTKAVYRNTGQLNAMGAPMLTKLADLPPVTIHGEPYCFFIGMRDHDQDGVYDAFYLVSGVHYVYEGPPARHFIKGALYRKVNSAGPGQTPVLGDEVPIERAGQLWTENFIPSDFCDVDGDGDLDIIGNNQPLDRIPSRPQNCYWPNTAPKGAAPCEPGVRVSGTRRVPPVYGKARLIPNAYNQGGYGIWRADNAAYHGLFIEDGYCVRYVERTGQTLPGQIPGYTDRGVLQQRNARCAVDGFNGVDVEDWDGDGDWDLISGDESGHLWLVKNVGTNERPVFATPFNIEANAEPIRIMRWHYVQDGNPEYYLGQTKPRYADWDGDGDYDLVAANNTNRLVLFENVGSRGAPAFARSDVIRVGESAEAFAWRCGPALVDWNGDGIMDLVTGNKDGQLCLFLRAREGNDLTLQPGRPLPDEAGKPFNAGHVEVCDWDGDGDWDVIAPIGAWGKAGPAFFENAGNNAGPRFRAPVRLKCWGKEITLCAHEHSFAAVDWFGAGKPDLVCGAESGLFYLFSRPTLDAPAPPPAKLAETVELRP